AAGWPWRVAHRGLSVRRAMIDQPQPALRDPVDEPQPDDTERQPRDENADAERGHHEEQAQRDPQEPEPERPDLPAEVGLEPGAARLAPLHIVQDDGDDRGPASEEGAHDGGDAGDARD